MKRKELEKILKEMGSTLIRNGGNHDFWENRNGYRFPVPRHSEIDERLAKEIIKQASM